MAYFVPPRGLEPLPLARQASDTCASANSATGAKARKHYCLRKLKSIGLPIKAL